MRQAHCRGADGRRERGHRRDRAGTEGRDVEQRGRQRWQCQRRKHSEEMRAAGDAVQHTEAERRMDMAKPPQPRRSR